MECVEPVKTYQISLSEDKSDLTVQRIEFNGVYWYYIPSEKVWIKSSGFVVPGVMTPNQKYEEGVIQDDRAALFRALIKLNQMIDVITNELHTKTTLFKVKKDNINAKNEESKTPSSRSESQPCDGPLSQISGLPNS